MTIENTVSLIEMIAAAYPRFEVLKSEETITVWHECLEDLDYDKAKIATKNVIKVSEYPPTIAEIRNNYEEIAKEEKKLRDTCNYNYKLCRGIYPKELEEGYGYNEFVAKVMTAKPEKRIEAAQYIYSHMNKVVYSGEEVPDFVEIIKGIK
jgi:hypothetical protein